MDRDEVIFERNFIVAVLRGNTGGSIWLSDGIHSKSTVTLHFQINYIISLSKLIKSFQPLSILVTPPKLYKKKMYIITSLQQQHQTTIQAILI